jgi:hypothetical protein
MTTYILDIDLIGHPELITEHVEADCTEAATAIVKAMWPDARSITVTGVAHVPAAVVR